MPKFSTTAGDAYMVCYKRDWLGFGPYTEQDDPDGVNGKHLSQTLTNLLDGQTFSDIILLNHGYWKDQQQAQDDFTAWINGWWAQMPGDVAQGMTPLFVATHWPSNPSDILGKSDSASASSLTSLCQSLDMDMTAYPKLQALLVLLGQQPDGVASDQPVSADMLTALQAAMLELFPDQDQNPLGDLLTNTITWGMVAAALLKWIYSIDLSQHPYVKFVVALVNYWVGVDAFKRYSDDAASFGKGAVHDLVALLGTHAKTGTRFHVMGHSLGSIVTSALLQQGHLKQDLPGFGLVYLAQGALSSHSFAQQVAAADNQPGIYAQLPGDSTLIHGPVLASYSTRDAMVGVLYFAVATHYGWVGASTDSSSQTVQPGDCLGLAVEGFAGDLLWPDSHLAPAQVVPPDQAGQVGTYAPGHVYSLNGTSYIAYHGDICNPAASQAFCAALQAAMAH